MDLGRRETNPFKLIHFDLEQPMKLKYAFLPLVAALLSGCAADSDITSPVPGHGFIPVALSVGDTQAATRSLGETPDLGALRLHVMVYDQNGMFVKHIAQNDGSGDMANVRVENNVVKYDLRLPYSPSPRRIHLVASAAELDFAAGALETAAMPAMVTRNGDDAYWNMVTVSCIGQYDSDTKTTTSGPEAQALADVKLIRNFAKITVTAADGIPFEGFVVANRPDRATAVPYILQSTGGFGHFPDYDAPLTQGQTRYENLTETQGFTGTQIAGTQLQFTAAADFTGENDFSMKPVYLYERPAQDKEKTFAVVKARFKDKTWYYRVDLGKRNAAGQTDDFHLLRNFAYTVTVTAITGEGAPDLATALASSASNNLSYTETTQPLNTISNTTDMLHVEYTEKTFVSDSPSNRLTWDYTVTDESGKETALTDPDEFEAVIYDDPFDVLDTTGLREGSDSKKYYAVNWDAANKCFYIDYSVNKTVSTYKAKIRIYRKNGLGREIDIIARLPLEFTNTEHTEAIGMDSKEYADTTALNAASFPDKMTDVTLTSGTNPGILDDSRKYGNAKNSPLNLYLKLPADLSRSMFPMVFTFESRTQILYPNPAGALTTSSGATTIDKSQTINIGGNQVPSPDRRIIFTHTLELDEYTRLVKYNRKTDTADGTTRQYVLLTVPFLFTTAVATGDPYTSTDFIWMKNDYSTPVRINYTR